MVTLLNNILKHIGKYIVVESGTSDIWTYKKYADGTCECWGRWYVSSGTNWQDYITGLSYSVCNNLGFPFTIYYAIPIIVCEFADTNIGWVAAVTHTDTSVSWLTIKNSSGTNSRLSAYIQIKGRWK